MSGLQGTGTIRGRRTQRASRWEPWLCLGHSQALFCQPCATTPPQVLRNGCVSVGRAFLVDCACRLHAVQASCAPDSCCDRAGFASFSLSSSLASSAAMVAVLAVRSSGSHPLSSAAEGRRSSGADASASVGVNGGTGKGGKGGLGWSQRTAGKAATYERREDTLVVPELEGPEAWALGGQRALAAAAVALLLLLLVGQGLTGGC